MEGTLSLFDWRPVRARLVAGADVRASSSGAPTSGATSGRGAGRPERCAGGGGGSQPTAAGVGIRSCSTARPPAPIRVRDQVIELCVQRGLEDDAPSRDLADQAVGRRSTQARRPSMASPHGRARGLPVVRGGARTRSRRCSRSAEVIVGYNLSFDIDMLQAEYARIGKPLLDFSTARRSSIAFRLWQQCEPRSLQHAHQRFVGDEFAAAHTASADVAATGRVLAGMLRALRPRRSGLGADRDQVRSATTRSARAGSGRRAICGGRARSSSSASASTAARRCTSSPRAPTAASSRG